MDQTLIQDPHLRYQISPAFEALRIATATNETYTTDQGKLFGLLRTMDTSSGEVTWCSCGVTEQLYDPDNAGHYGSSSKRNESEPEEITGSEELPLILNIFTKSQLLYGAYVLSGYQSYMDKNDCVHVLVHEDTGVSNISSSLSFGSLENVRTYIANLWNGSLPQRNSSSGGALSALKTLKPGEIWDQIKNKYSLISGVSIGGWKLQDGLQASASLVRTLISVSLEVLSFCWYLLTEYGATVIVFMSTLRQFVGMEKSPLDSCKYYHATTEFVLVVTYTTISTANTVVDYIPVQKRRRDAVRDALQIQVATSLLLPIRLGLIHAFGTTVVFSLFGISFPFVAGILSGLLPFIPSVSGFPFLS